MHPFPFRRCSDGRDLPSALRRTEGSAPDQAVPFEISPSLSAAFVKEYRKLTDAPAIDIHLSDRQGLLLFMLLQMALSSPLCDEPMRTVGREFSSSILDALAPSGPLLTVCELVRVDDDAQPRARLTGNRWK